MTIFKLGCAPTKVEPNHIQAYCARCGCVFDAAKEEGILVVGSDENYSYRSFNCPVCGKELKVYLEIV